MSDLTDPDNPAISSDQTETKSRTRALPNELRPQNESTAASEHTNTQLFKVVFVLGGPGAGKSTICKRLITALNESNTGGLYQHLSAGDYLRELAHAGPMEQPPAEAYAGLTAAEMLGTMQRAELMESSKIVDILYWKLRKMQDEVRSTDYGGDDGDGCRGTAFLVDGFPRTLESAQVWEYIVGEPCLVLLIHSRQQTAKGRFLSRGRELADTAEKHAKRHDQYLKESAPILDRYMEMELVMRVDNEDDLDETVAEALQYIRHATDGHTEGIQDVGVEFDTTRA